MPKLPPKNLLGLVRQQGAARKKLQGVHKARDAFAGVAHLSMQALRVDRTTLKRSLPLREYGTGYAT